MQNFINEAKMKALTNQRNHALNECVVLAAQITMYEAKDKESQAQIGVLKAEIEALKAKKKKKVIQAV